MYYSTAFLKWVLAGQHLVNTPIHMLAVKHHFFLLPFFAATHADKTIKRVRKEDRLVDTPHTNSSKVRKSGAVSLKIFYFFISWRAGEWLWNFIFAHFRTLAVNVSACLPPPPLFLALLPTQSSSSGKRRWVLFKQTFFFSFSKMSEEKRREGGERREGRVCGIRSGPRLSIPEHSSLH